MVLTEPKCPTEWIHRVVAVLGAIIGSNRPPLVLRRVVDPQLGALSLVAVGHGQPARVKQILMKTGTRTGKNLATRVVTVGQPVP